MQCRCAEIINKIKEINEMMALKAQLLSNSLIHRVATVLLGIILLTIGAQIRIPLEPVPVTLQTVAVLIIGYTFTPVHGVAAVGIYIVSALLGAPITAGMVGGIGILFKPALGYLIGFVFAVYFLSTMCATKRHSFTNMLFLGLLANILIYVFGVSYMALFMGMGIGPALQVGLLPFVIPGVVKNVILCSVLKALEIKA
jgi:biotin transport system substrate-specific component